MKKYAALLIIGIPATYIVVMYASITRPYIPSPLMVGIAKYGVFSLFVLPAVYLLLFYKKGSSHGWQLWLKRTKTWRQRCGQLLSIPAFAALMAWSSLFVPAWPTYWFADQAFHTETRFIEAERYGSKFRHLVKVTVQDAANGKTLSFPWDEDDINRAQLKPGDRLVLEGREWFLGKAVERWSK